MYKTGFPEI